MTPFCQYTIFSKGFFPNMDRIFLRKSDHWSSGWPLLVPQRRQLVLPPFYSILFCPVSPFPAALLSVCMATIHAAAQHSKLLTKFNFQFLSGKFMELDEFKIHCKGNILSWISRVWPQCGMYHEQSLSRFWELLFDGQNATEGVTTGWWPPSIKLGFISHFRKLKMLQLLSHIYEQTLAHFGIDIWHIWSMLIIKANRDKGSRPRDSS